MGYRAMSTLASALAAFGGPQAPDAAHLLSRAVDAMGGARIERLATIRIAGIGYTNALEQSERPEGPWIKTFEQFTVLRDLRNGRTRSTRQTRSSPWSPAWSPDLTLVADTGAAIYLRGGRSIPARSQDRVGAIMALRLSPERLLFTARAAADLRVLPDTTIAGVPNHRVGFGLDGKRVEVVLDANTFLPAGYVMRGVSTARFDWVWGDATIAVWYSLWSLDPPGIRYPRMMLEEFNGQPLREVAFTEVVFDAVAPADSFAIPDAMRAAYVQAAQRMPDARTIPFGHSFRNEPLEPIAVAAGVTVHPGTWAVSFLRQDDGIVVLEAPISSDYSAQALAEAERRYPGVPVKAVVTTSDAWPHLSGIREYVARGIPVYHLDLNRPILERLVAAPHRTEPDALERARRAPIWRPVREPTVIGTGANRVQLVPVRGEGGERMLMAYLPERRLLYASDLVQRQPDGTFWSPQYLSEVVEAVRRYGIAVDTVWAMHTDPFPWSDLTAAVAEAWGRTASP